MKSNLSFSYEHSLLTPDQIAQVQPTLVAAMQGITQAQEMGYNTPYASVNLPADMQLHAQVHRLVAQKKKLNPRVLVIIGIGGSNLGTMAVLEALYGTFYNAQQPDTQVYFADTVDTDYMLDIMLLVQQELQEGNEVLLNVVSKSGTTTETIANFELFLYLLQTYKKEAYHEYVVVTTDEGSKLWQLAQEHNFTCLTIPEQVGGRYSVFSAVGLFPLALLGVDIDALCAGAHDMLPQLLGTDITKNMAALSAAWLAVWYAQDIYIHDTFVFSVDLQAMGKWYRQLLAESIGKTDAAGKPIGIVPTVSVGSTDLHSVGQLYLGGPRSICTTFISVGHSESEITVPTLPMLETLVPHLQGITLPTIMHAIMEGTQCAYAKHKLPFVSVVLPEKSAYYIGQLLQFKMLEVIYLGALLQVNPFDQPHVELYKKETRKILAHE